jgi:predicted nucleotidyltransferase
MDYGTDPALEDGLRVLPPGYRPLFDRARAVFEDDQRVRAMWVHGAMARHAIDAASDLDISIAVADDEFEAFTTSWKEWLALITETVSVVGIVPGSFYALTPTCERLDVISERVSALPHSSLRRRLVVFDRDGVTASLPQPTDPGPDKGIIRYSIEEAVRQAANFPTVLVREDWLLGVVAVQQVHQFLYSLFVEDNKPQPPTGPKQWSFKLSDRHRRLLEALPVPQPERSSVLDARQAALSVLFQEAPLVAARNGVEYPHALVEAVRSFLEEQGLGVGDPIGPRSAG